MANNNNNKNSTMKGGKRRPLSDWNKFVMAVKKNNPNLKFLNALCRHTSGIPIFLFVLLKELLIPSQRFQIVAGHSLVLVWGIFKIF